MLCKDCLNIRSRIFCWRATSHDQRGRASGSEVGIGLFQISLVKASAQQIELNRDVTASAHPNFGSRWPPWSFDHRRSWHVFLIIVLPNRKQRPRYVTPAAASTRPAVTTCRRLGSARSVGLEATGVRRGPSEVGWCSMASRWLYRWLFAEDSPTRPIVRSGRRAALLVPRRQRRTRALARCLVVFFAADRRARTRRRRIVGLSPRFGNHPDRSRQ
jgi:hypothetical protein